MNTAQAMPQNIVNQSRNRRGFGLMGWLVIFSCALVGINVAKQQFRALPAAPAQRMAAAATREWRRAATHSDGQKGIPQRSDGRKPTLYAIHARAIKKSPTKVPNTLQRIRAQKRRTISKNGQNGSAHRARQAGSKLQRATRWTRIVKELITPGKKSARKPVKRSIVADRKKLENGTTETAETQEASNDFPSEGPADGKHANRRQSTSENDDLEAVMDCERTTAQPHPGGGAPQKTEPATSKIWPKQELRKPGQRKMCEEQMRWRRIKEWIKEYIRNHAKMHLRSIEQGNGKRETADTNSHPTEAASKNVPVTDATPDNALNRRRNRNLKQSK